MDLCPPTQADARRTRVIRLDDAGYTEAIRDADGSEQVTGHAPGPGLLTRAMVDGSATLADLEEREEQQGRSTFPADSPIARIGKRLNKRRGELGEAMSWYRSQSPASRHRLRHTSIRHARALMRPMPATAMASRSAPRARGAGRPRARATARASSRGGSDSGDGSGSEPPGETTGPPLLYLIDGRYGRINRAMAAFVREHAE